MRYVFPAVFEQDEDSGGYCVYFPDLESICTQGDDFMEAMDMAEDALCLMLYDMEKNGTHIPKASNPGSINVKPNEIINLVACDTQFYKNYFEGKSVKINATIPLWLKEAGEKKHVNFSQILQKGVKEYLRLQ
jgi:predicted RNase H-like HicB family nuclease